MIVKTATREAAGNVAIAVLAHTNSVEICAGGGEFWVVINVIGMTKEQCDRIEAAITIAKATGEQQ